MCVYVCEGWGGCLCMRLGTCVYIGMCVCPCLCKYMCVCVVCVHACTCGALDDVNFK